MSGLSEKKKKEFIEAFSLFDKDGDKKISEEELANVSVLFSEGVASQPRRSQINFLHRFTEILEVPQVQPRLKA